LIRSGVADAQVEEGADRNRDQANIRHAHGG